MNKVFLIGNLTRDPELRETPSGVAVCRYSIAVGRNYTDASGERQTDFFNCVAWRGQAESIAKYCKKGNKVAVTGSIQLRNYTDNEGIKRTAVDIITQDIEFLTPKSREDEAMEEPTPIRKKPTLQTMDDDGDIPF
jgi:single-strand DNA-binding protein